MDLSNVNPTIVVAIVFGVVAVAGFFIYRHKMLLRAKVGEHEFEMKGGNEIPASHHKVEIEDVSSKKGSFEYEDDTGDSLSAKKIEAEKDVSFKRTSSDKEPHPPK